jgi:alkylation response protein AidB-like acyl-CoA dehydrogenase
MGLKLVGPVIYTFGTTAQKATHLPPLLAGETFWAQGFSEPGAGSDLARLRTRAEKVPGGYKITGSKIWTTRAQFANRMFCLVRTGQHEKPQAGITFLLVDMAQPGIAVRPIITLSGEHEVNEVFLDGVFTPDDWRIGAEGDGWSIAKFLLKNERGKSCFAPALLADIAQLRRQAAANPPAHAADRQAIRQRIATLSAEAEALEMTELRTLDQLNRNEQAGPQSLMTKLIASEIRQGIEQTALALQGPTGLALPWPRTPSNVASQATRYLDSRAWSIFGGTSEVQLNIIARTVLNL